MVLTKNNRSRRGQGKHGQSKRGPSFNQQKSSRPRTITISSESKSSKGSLSSTINISSKSETSINDSQDRRGRTSRGRAQKGQSNRGKTRRGGKHSQERGKSSTSRAPRGPKLTASNSRSRGKRFQNFQDNFTITRSVAAAYKFLGLPVTASEGEVNAAYRVLCLTHHPDKGGKKEDFQNLQFHIDIIRKATK